jgi:large subunit ribosomal protein L10
MAKPAKIEAVADIAGRFSSSEAALLTEYRGLTVGQMAEIRGALRAAGADYRVLKNTLARIALRNSGLDDLEGMLEGPTAIAFCRGDVAAAAKVLDEATTKFPVLVIKGGLLKGSVMSAEQARRLARLEPREVQLAKIATMMNSPAQQLATVLSALLRNLGSMLAQVVERKAEAGVDRRDASDQDSEVQSPAADAALAAAGES